MGGKTERKLYTHGIIADYINEIFKISETRAFEISGFYYDLEKSIKTVGQSIKRGGYSIYVVGNRLVKDIQLPTDQFIAEKFEQYGLRHVKTYERLLGNKAMPSKNSPSNKIGDKKSTMSTEYIVICSK